MVSLTPRQWWWLALAATLAFRFWLGAALPITADEAYFTLWGRYPALGYYDHPPMVGWLLAPLVAVSQAEWVVRLPSILLPAALALLARQALAAGFARDADTADLAALAVLPFQGQGSDPQLTAFAHGLAEDITTGLSRFSHLQVVSRHSALQYAGRALDVRAASRELGARFALEGALRKASSAVRASVRLIDAATGTHLWAETYDRDLAVAGIFEVQDEITDRVVATVADPYGVLVRTMAPAVRAAS